MDQGAIPRTNVGRGISQDTPLRSESYNISIDDQQPADAKADAEYPRSISFSVPTQAKKEEFTRKGDTMWQWGALQGRIKEMYQFLKQENEEKFLISEDLRKLQGKAFKQILKYKGLLKERLLASQSSDEFQACKSTVRVAMQNFENADPKLVQAINKNVESSKSLIAKVVHNPLLIPALLNFNDSNPQPLPSDLDQFFNDLNSLFFNSILHQDIFKAPILQFQAALIQNELNRASSIEEVFTQETLTTRAIFGLSKHGNCLTFLENFASEQLTSIITHPEILELNIDKLYSQFLAKTQNRKSRSRRTSQELRIDFFGSSDLSNTANSNRKRRTSSGQRIGNDFYKIKTDISKSIQASPIQTSIASTQEQSHNPITSIKSFFKTMIPKIGKKLGINDKQPLNIPAKNPNKLSNASLSKNTPITESSAKRRTVSTSIDDIEGLAGVREKSITFSGAMDMHENFTGVDMQLLRSLRKGIHEIDTAAVVTIQSRVDDRLSELEFLVIQFLSALLDKIHDYPLEIKMQCSILKQLAIQQYGDDERTQKFISQLILKIVFQNWILVDIQQVCQRQCTRKKELKFANFNCKLVCEIAMKVIFQQQLDEYPLSRLNDLIKLFEGKVNAFVDQITGAYNHSSIVNICSNTGNYSARGSVVMSGKVNPTQNSNQNNPENIQDVQSLCFSLENLQIISLLIIQAPVSFREAKPSLYREALKIQERLRDVFKETHSSRNCYYICWELPQAQQQNYIETLFSFETQQRQRNNSKKIEKPKKNNLSPQTTETCVTFQEQRTKDMLILALLSINSLSSEMRLGRGQDLTLLLALEQYVIRPTDQIVNVSPNQPKVNMSTYLEYLRLMLSRLPDSLSKREFEPFLRDIESTLKTRYSELTKQAIALKSCYFYQKRLLQSKISYFKSQQQEILRQTVRQNMLQFLTGAYVNITILTSIVYPDLTKQDSHNSNPTSAALSFKIIRNEELTSQDAKSIANRNLIKPTTTKLFKNGFSPEAPARCISILDFVSYLVSTRQLATAIVDRIQLSSFNSLISRYLRQIEKKAQDLPFYQQLSEEQRNYAFSIVEEYVSSAIHKGCMPMNESQQDKDFLQQAKKFQFMSEVHQGVERLVQEEGIWKSTAYELSCLNKQKSHISKLELIEKCWNTMVQILTLVPGEGTGADDCLPLWIYILLIAKPPFIHSNLKQSYEIIHKILKKDMQLFKIKHYFQSQYFNMLTQLYCNSFIEVMMGKDSKTMTREQAYIFTQLQSAVSFIKDLTEDNVLTYLKTEDQKQKLKEYFQDYEKQKQDAIIKEKVRIELQKEYENINDLSKYLNLQDSQSKEDSDLKNEMTQQPNQDTSAGLSQLSKLKQGPSIHFMNDEEINDNEQQEIFHSQSQPQEKISVKEKYFSIN